VTAAVALDGVEAARLADALWSLGPTPSLVVPRMCALLAVGRVDEAEALGIETLGDRDAGRDDVELLGTLARLRASLHGDDEAALDYLERARIALEGAPLPPPLVEIKAQAHYRADRTHEAIESARPLAERAPPEDTDGVDRWLRMRMVWAQCLQRDERLHEGIALLEGVPAELGRGRPARADLDADLGRMLWFAGRVREAADVITRAADGESGLSTQNRARLLNTAGMARYGVGDRPGSLKLWEQAGVLFEQIDFPVDQVRIRNNLCVGYREAGQWERAREAGEWALARAREIDDHEGVAMVAGNLGDLAIAQDRLDDADEHFRVSLAVAKEHGLDGELVELARRRAELAVLRNDPNAAALAEQALEQAQNAASTVEACKAAALLALTHARAGELRRMEERLAEAVEPLREAGASGELAEVRLWAAQALLISGRVVDALQQATRALVYADEVEHTQLRKRADAVVERVRRVQGASARSTRLDRVLELAVAVAREQDVRRVLHAIAVAALDLLEGERSFVLVEIGGEPSVVASAARPGVETGAPSMSVVKRAITDGREVIAADLGERADLRAAASVQAMELRSAMCVPMLDGELRVGALYVDSRAASEEELTRAATLLRALGSYAAVAVHNARHLEEARGRARQAAEIAHDLRCPASSIHLAASELLGLAGSADPRRDRLVRVLEASQRIQDLAGEFLRERGPAMRPMDLSAHLRDVAALLSYEAQGKGITLQLQAEPGLHIRGDRNGLSRVVTNLVTNAVKYSPDGGTVTLSATAETSWVVLRVRDRGEGIPEADLTRVFQRGSQAEGAKEGYGLGLAIALRLVTEHGGTIEAGNHPDGGAEFTVRLPLDSG
jgi:signal transduction histidine kinase/tetratricopeptide (TPR) repeat protein